MTTTQTQVAIVGAGPAGLLQSWALRAVGIDSVVIESGTAEQAVGRVRAAMLEHSVVERLTRLGLGDNLARNGLTHTGVDLQFAGERHEVDFHKLLGRSVTIYGQQEVVADLIAAHRAAGSAILWRASDVELHGLHTDTPSVSCTVGEATVTVFAEYIVGADGFNGVSRRSIPAQPGYSRDYPYAWLGILADVAPSTERVVYALHENGFAMHSMRSLTQSRLYLQVPSDTRLDAWPDSRVWDELHVRLELPGSALREGPVADKAITPLRSFVTSRMRYGRLFLIGDAAHLVPPTAAKGLNGAITDVTLLTRALADHYIGNDLRLDEYERIALARQWKVQQFSQWMTETFHRLPENDSASEFQYRASMGRHAYLTDSPLGAQSFAEQYTGIPIE